jgi:plasmid maintenance system antidote protein VapI
MPYYKAMNETQKLKRLANKMTQTQLAKALKCSQPQIHRMLAGIAAPMRLDMAHKINKLFDKENGNDGPKT